MRKLVITTIKDNVFKASGGKLCSSPCCAFTSGLSRSSLFSVFSLLGVTAYQASSGILNKLLQMLHISNTILL